MRYAIFAVLIKAGRGLYQSLSSSAYYSELLRARVTKRGYISKSVNPIKSAGLIDGRLLVFSYLFLIS